MDKCCTVQTSMRGHFCNLELDLQLLRKADSLQCRTLHTCSAACFAGIETREFTLSWEEKDMCFEVVDRKMKALMSELGWSDPSELEGAVPFFDPDPHVVDSTGTRVEGSMMIFAGLRGQIPLQLWFRSPGRSCRLPPDLPVQAAAAKGGCDGIPW
ncbi:HERC1 [Symbiodinium microadriaticum]|nr:HERC1 [Symbiodinium microadriaticum]